MNIKQSIRFVVIIALTQIVSSCFLLQEAEGDIHPEYPNILLNNDTLNLPLKPLKIENEHFAFLRDDGGLLEEVPAFRRYKINGKYIYSGEVGSFNLYYDHTGKLVKKIKRSADVNDINLFGQLFRYEEDDNNGTFYLFDFYTEKKVGTVQTVCQVDLKEGNYTVYRKDLIHLLPPFPSLYLHFPSRKNQREKR
ncbi:MAG: hypothetical protein LIP00_00850 [Parabacteroides sp.]|nr:hypothetical protein [Parabacteroides sp.]